MDNASVAHPTPSGPPPPTRGREKKEVLMTDQPADGLMPFHAMEILKRAKAIEATGRTVCHLEVGEPGAPPAPRVIEAVAKALPLAQGYTNAKGLGELRDGLARYYEEQHRVSVDPESIL